uniref:Uncharacterized protein n=1 Tax=Coccidioides posadasii RMSCC 3488 TaxID=454284 RepID=A0A0J6FE82_COCPO|nr:hypothetical protein CPAG_07748 [Coccidioides posadasii RMSCC 3488]
MADPCLEVLEAVDDQRTEKGSEKVPAAHHDSNGNLADLTANVSDHQRIPQDKSNRNRVSDTNQGQEHIRGGLRRAEGSGSFPCLGSILGPRAPHRRTKD